MARGLPRVTLLPTRDLTSRIPERGGTGVAAIIVNARKGPVGVPTFVRNETEYLRTFCPNETIAVGEDEAHFSALAFLREGAGLWVVRAKNDGMRYAGIGVKANSSSLSGTGLSHDTYASVSSDDPDGEPMITSPGDLYSIYAKNPGKWGNRISIAFTRDDASDALDAPLEDFQVNVGALDDLYEKFTIPASLITANTNGTVYLPNLNTEIDATAGSRAVEQGNDEITYNSGGDPTGPDRYHYSQTSGKFVFQTADAATTIDIEASVSAANRNENSFSFNVDLDGSRQQKFLLPVGWVVTSLSGSTGTTFVGTAHSSATLSGNGQWHHDSSTGVVTVQYASGTTGTVTVTVVRKSTINLRISGTTEGVVSGDGAEINVHVESLPDTGYFVSVDNIILADGTSLVREGITTSPVSIGTASKRSLDDAMSMTFTYGGSGSAAYIRGRLGTAATQANVPGEPNVANGAGTGELLTPTSTLEVNAFSNRSLIGASISGKFVRSAASAVGEDRRARARTLVVYHQGPSDAAPVERERFVVSANEELKDGYGRSVFAENVVADSRFIGIKVNNDIASDSNHVPKVTDVRVAANEDASASPATSLTGLVPADRSLSGGVDGDPVDGSTKVTDGNSNAIYNALLDANSYGFQYLLDGGDTGIRSVLSKVAQTRADCIAVLSGEDDEFNRNNDGISPMNVRDASLKGGIGTNSSFAAMYTPYVVIRDKFNDREIIVPPDGYAAAVMARTARNNKVWTAPAGTAYGVLPTSWVRGLAHRYSDAQAGDLYDRGINPIILREGYGFVIYGQKTTQTRPSALDRINVRLLLNEVLTRIKVFLEEVNFQENDVETRSLVRTRVSAYMDTVYSNRGILEPADVVCDETNNLPTDIEENSMNVHVVMRPTRTIEYINLLGVLTSQGATVTAQ